MQEVKIQFDLLEAKGTGYWILADGVVPIFLNGKELRALRDKLNALDTI
jgi:hypothetical protein